MLASQVLMVAIGIGTARLLGPGPKGQIAAITTWVQILIWVGTIGLNTSIAVRVAETFRTDDGRRQLSTALGNSLAYSLVIGTVLAAVFLALLTKLLSHLGSNTAYLLLLSLVGVPPGILIYILLPLQLSIDRPARLRAAQAMAPAVMALALAGAFALKRSLNPVDIAVASLVSTFAVLALLSWGLPWRSGILHRQTLARDLRFGAATAAGGILNLVNLRLDMLALSLFVSNANIGLYSAANNMMGPILILPLAAAAHLTPKVAGRTSRSSATGLILREAVLFSGLAAVTGIALAVLSPFVVPLLLGEAYRPIIRLIWILIPGFLARAFAAVLVAGAYGQRRARVGNISEGAAVFLTISLLPFAIDSFGIIGAALVSTLAYTTSAIVALIVLRRPDPDTALRTNADTDTFLPSPSPSS